MFVNERKRLDVLLAVASGGSVVKALMSAGYSETTANHKAGRILSGRKYTDTARKYVEGIAEVIGLEAIAAERKLISNAKRWTPEIASAIRSVREKYEMSDTEKDNKDTQMEATKKPRTRKWDRLMAGHDATLGERIVSQPKYSEKVAALLKRGREIDGAHLGDLGKALLERDLVTPPKDNRARIQVARTALEASHVIGAGAIEMHLHQHNHAVLPLTVQRMLLQKMEELSASDNMLQLSEPLPVPPPPIEGQTFRAECDPSAAEEAAQALLDRKAGSLKNSLTQLQEQARQGAQAVAKENELKMIHEMDRR
jgi:hypothetical protein